MQITLTTLGRLTDVEQFGNIILKTVPDGRLTRLKDVGRVVLGAKNEDVSVAPRRQGDGLPGHLPDARRQRARHARPRDGQDGGAEKDFSRGLTYDIGFDTTPYTRESIREVSKTLRDAIILVAIVVLLVPAELAVVDHSAGRRAGGHRRHLRGHAGVRVQPEQPDAVRPGAGHRHRRRRRDRGRRGGGASHRARAVAARRDDPRHGAGVRAR